MAVSWATTASDLPTPNSDLRTRDARVRRTKRACVLGRVRRLQVVQGERDDSAARALAALRMRARLGVRRGVVSLTACVTVASAGALSGRAGRRSGLRRRNTSGGSAAPSDECVDLTRVRDGARSSGVSGPASKGAFDQ